MRAGEVRTGGKGRKYGVLQEILRPLGRVAVAFSGGIDSTFLLHAACDALGSGSVTALHGVSCLLPARSIASSARIFQRHFAGRADLRQITLRPLLWNEFVTNGCERCYICKKHTYTIFKKEIGQSVLLDGTNVDDLSAHRPGLKAVSELGVQTPLAEAGLTKPEIRDLARGIGLENYDQPANSCLATRIPAGRPIQAAILRLIDAAEHLLHEQGFLGCRVRVGPERTVIEVRTGDRERVQQNWEPILRHFAVLGLSQVVLAPQGRP